MEALANSLLGAAKVAGGYAAYQMVKKGKQDAAAKAAAEEGAPDSKPAASVPTLLNPKGSPVRAATVTRPAARPPVPARPAFDPGRPTAATRPAFDPSRVKSAAAKQVLAVTDKAGLTSVQNLLLRSRLERSISDEDYSEASRALSHRRGALREAGQQATAAASATAMKGLRTELWSQNTLAGLDSVRAKAESDPSLSPDDRGYLTGMHGGLRNRWVQEDPQATLGIPTGKRSDGVWERGRKPFRTNPDDLRGEQGTLF